METQDSTCQFYANIVGVEIPWIVTDVVTDEIRRKITVRIEYDKSKKLPCPVCAQSTTFHDTRVRTLRYLDTCTYETFLEVHVPRIKCEKDGVKQIDIPFSEKHSRFTSRFERAIIDWLKDAPLSTVAEHFGLSWDEVDGIMQRAVRRGLERRRKTIVKHIGIDETSFQKRHNYVTVLVDKEGGYVIDVLDGRTAETLKTWFTTQKDSDLSQLQSISMDMWDAYIKAVLESVPGSEDKIAFDRFHVSKMFNQALDQVRRREHALLLKTTGESPMTKSRFQWLTNSNLTDNRSGKRKTFLNLSRLNLETSRAWRIKELASTLWDYIYMNVAHEAWKKLLYWISHCRIPEMIKVGKTIRNYFWGILNAIRLKVTNALCESKNSAIQRIKFMACGFRNKARFKTVILFHLGNLDLYPSTI